MTKTLAIHGAKPVRKEYLIFGSPDIGKAEIEEVVDSLKSGWLGTGPKVKKFEEDFSKFVQTKYAKALNSCTAGLHLAQIAAGVGRGDEVITTPLTFASTANVILHVGAKPIFVDVDIQTGNIDVEKIEKKITKKTKAIIPVHLHGRPVEMNPVLKTARKHKLTIIEDAAHAAGASYKGKKIGSIGDMTAFSFYVTKNIVTGEGGMVTTDNKRFADLIELYALHGMTKGAWKRYSDSGFKHYLIQVPGYKYNMMDIQASIGIHQLKKFNKGQIVRRRIWNQYNRAFADLPVTLPAQVPKHMTHAYHLYTILLNLDKLKTTRDMIQQALHKENIGSGIHFISLHLHPFYKHLFNFKSGDFPNAEFISNRTISLPLSSKLTQKDVDDVIRATKKVINYFTL